MPPVNPFPNREPCRESGAKVQAFGTMGLPRTRISDQINLFGNYLGFKCDSLHAVFSSGWRPSPGPGVRKFRAFT